MSKCGSTTKRERAREKESEKKRENEKDFASRKHKYRVHNLLYIFHIYIIAHTSISYTNLIAFFLQRITVLQNPLFYIIFNKQCFRTRGNENVFLLQMSFLSLFFIQMMKLFYKHYPIDKFCP